jgi:hypothetical protein
MWPHAIFHAIFSSLCSLVIQFNEHLTLQNPISMPLSTLVRRVLYESSIFLSYFIVFFFFRVFTGFPEALKAHVANKDRLHQQLLQTKQRDADDDAHLVRAASAPAPTITLTKPDDNTMHELRKAGSSSALLCSHPGTEPSCAECNDRLLFPESGSHCYFCIISLRTC